MFHFVHSSVLASYKNFNFNMNLKWRSNSNSNTMTRIYHPNCRQEKRGDKWRDYNFNVKHHVIQHPDVFIIVFFVCMMMLQVLLYNNMHKWKFLVYLYFILVYVYVVVSDIREGKEWRRMWCDKTNINFIQF